MCTSTSLLGSVVTPLMGPLVPVVGALADPLAGAAMAVKPACNMRESRGGSVLLGALGAFARRRSPPFLSSHLLTPDLMSTDPFHFPITEDLSSISSSKGPIPQFTTPMPLMVHIFAGKDRISDLFGALGSWGPQVPSKNSVFYK